MRPRWALVPVKSLDLAKSRLSPALSSDERRALASDLLYRTLDVLSRTGGLDGVAVVTRDPAVEEIAAARGASPLLDQAADLGRIIDGALTALEARGAASALIVMADLPTLRAEDLEAMLELGERHPMVIAPDERDEGTNAMVLTPPGRTRTCFGRRGSFEAHLERAASLGIDVAVHRAPSIAYDLDTIDDLRMLKARS